MADNLSDHVRLPIKVILPNQGSERRVPGGGAPPKPFREVDTNYRDSLSKQITALRDSLGPVEAEVRISAARVRLHPKAVAKSHRPTRIFSELTCPIIGGGSLGELFVKATPQGLESVNALIVEGESERLIKEISSITSIEPVTPFLRRQGRSAFQILQNSPSKQPGRFLTRVRLFDFGSPVDQGELVEDFLETCRRGQLEVRQDGYDPRSYVYSVECSNVDDVETLARTIGVRSVIGMPLLRAVRPTAINIRPLPSGLPRRESASDVPIVAVVDSGVSPACVELNSWVVIRESVVAPPYRNPSHGTFVAGLICWGSQLNPNLHDIDKAPCAVFDLQVMPNWDAQFGDVDTLTEQELLQTLEDALKDHSNRIRVWNLSLGSTEPCSLDEFSAFAEQLDNLQEQYRVSFVISAGNYDTPPLLDFPRTQAQLDPGRITSPGDSLLGITVGAISHLSYASNGPKENEPSPFSRHGAGPNHIVKPDLVHYGGSCSIDAGHIAGITSVVGNQLGEDVGTSFAAPLVSRALAEIYHQITPVPSPVLARSLLTHHARDPRTGGRVPDGDENYLGFGRPIPPPYSIACEPYMSTLIFDDALRPGFFLEWDDFPYPPSLQRNGMFFGEVWMTIAFAPARGARWGTEYCETHVDAHFGVYKERVNKRTGEVTEYFEGLVPPEHRNVGQLYEDFQVRELRKWAPVRTYYGDLTKGEKGTRWRLKVQLLTRHGVEDAEAAHSQPFSLIVTISDPEKKAPVYDEMALIIRNRFQSQNLTVRDRVRIQTRSSV